MAFETVIGLEIHVQLKTESKIFCSDQNQYGATPNHHISAISLAHPGTLPRLNQDAIEKGILFAHAIKATIHKECYFDRKHYFYPDLPKGYQLTQDRVPICSGGHLSIDIENQKKKIRFHHTHLEEDAGKLIHQAGTPFSNVDLNRAGVPLIEIVTEPDFRSGAEVFDFLKKIQQLIRYIGISDANMEEGSMRCDCNVSVMPIGAQVYGTRAEVKNINSKKFAQIAINHEAKRQIKLIQSGKKVIQETRHFNADLGTTYSSRDKEDAHDYRYLPDPDIPPVSIAAELIQEIKSSLPKLPEEVKSILSNAYNLTDYQSEFISTEKRFFDYFESINSKGNNHSNLANFIINQVIPYAQDQNTSLESYPIEPDQIHEMLSLIEDGRIMNSVAMKKLVPELIKNPKRNILELAQELNLIIEQTDHGKLDQMIDNLLSKHPEEVKKYKSGKKALIGFFVGQAMRTAEKGIDAKALKARLVAKLNE